MLCVFQNISILGMRTCTNITLEGSVSVASKPIFAHKNIIISNISSFVVLIVLRSTRFAHFLHSFRLTFRNFEKWNFSRQQSFKVLVKFAKFDQSQMSAKCGSMFAKVWESDTIYLRKSASIQSSPVRERARRKFAKKCKSCWFR